MNTQKQNSSSSLFSNRRAFVRHSMSSIVGLVSVNAVIDKVNALDMDAFVNEQIENDTKNCDPKRDPKCIPKLTEAEALCKYGQSGQARADACKAVRAAGGTLPTKGSQGKSLGGAYAM